MEYHPVKQVAMKQEMTTQQGLITGEEEE